METKAAITTLCKVGAQPAQYLTKIIFSVPGFIGLKC